MSSPYKNKWTFIIPLIVAVISMALFFWAAATGWFGVAKWGSGAGEFCEAFRPGLIKQPANTWSNLGFVFAGLYIAYTLMTRQFTQSNSLTRSIFYAIFYSCIAILLGPGSMAMHATGTDLGGFFDMLSMYLICSFTTAYALERFFKLKPIHFLIIFSIILTSCIWADGQDYHIVFDFFGVTMFAFYISLTVIFELLNMYVRKKQILVRYAHLSFGALMLAFAVWSISLTGSQYCDSESLLQGHAAWHLLNAVSIYFLFRYYVSEEA